MTVTTEHNRIAYTAGAGATMFAYTFLILDAADLFVYKNGALQAASLYTVSGVGLGSGGNVTFTVAMAGGEKIVLLRETDPTQQVNLLEGSKLPADPTETMWDRLTILAQDLWERSTRAIKVPKTSGNALVELDLPDPALAANQNKALFINGSGALETRTILGTDIASPITAKGDLIQGSDSGTPEALAIGATDDLLTVVAGKAAWRTLANRLLGMLTTKGDLAVSTGATVQRKAAGANDTVLQPDSTQADGLIWSPHIQLAEIATPATPAANKLRAYVPTGAHSPRLGHIDADGGVYVYPLIWGRAAPATLTNSAAETTLLSETVKANALNGVGLGLWLNLCALLLNNSGANNGVTLRVKFGGFTICTLATGNVAASAIHHGLEMKTRILFAAGGGTPPWNATGVMRLGNVGISGASYGVQVTDLSVGSSAGIGNISTIVDQTLVVTAQLSAANANLSLLDIVLLVELL